MRYTLRKLKTMSCVGVTPGIMRFQVLQGYKRVIPFLNSFQRRRREKIGFGSAPGAENFGILDLTEIRDLVAKNRTPGTQKKAEGDGL